ncbi:hypothetical protein GQ53DRAFT_607222, partial [Thozetella sp. PMI_491]
GGDGTFRDFPDHLKALVADKLDGHHVESIVYPKYETRGELTQSTAAFLEWLREKVLDLRKQHLEKPWPANDRQVGVVLIAHSMGGFIASDTLFRLLDERRENSEGESSGYTFPLIQGILAFDTPYNGLARSMFVYGAFSNYQKVSGVFNVMTAISAAAPATLSRLATKRAAGAAAKSVSSSHPAWKAWQLVAVRTGTVGAIAAGGVAAYMHRKEIMEGMRSVRNLNKETVVQGYQQSVDAIGQGLAYINRGNVGHSFAWLSDHITFVGALMKPNELNRRLERLAALRGVGVHDFYASMGENGYWSGGYFVPERTFCAIPTKDQPASNLFSRHVVTGTADEIVAHTSLFKPEKNKGYERMAGEAANLVVSWFQDETELFDDPKFSAPVESDKTEGEAVDRVVEQVEGIQSGEVLEEIIADQDQTVSDEIPDESPIDIAAAASLVPLPDDAEEDPEKADQGEAGAKEVGKEKGDSRKAYLRHLFDIAEQAGTNARSFIPSKLPAVNVPKPSMPQMAVPTMPSLPKLPSV